MMKKLFSILMLAFPLFCLAQTSCVNEVDAKEAFLEKFYADLDNREDGILDYAFVKQHISPKALQVLKDEYDYECEGECLATWLFYYDAGGDDGHYISRTIKVIDNNRFLVKHHYELGDYEVVLIVVKIKGAYRIDGIQPVR